MVCLPARSSVEPDDTVVHLLPIRVSLGVVADDVGTSLSSSIGIIPGLVAIVSLLLSEESSVVVGRGIGTGVVCGPSSGVTTC